MEKIRTMILLIAILCVSRQAFSDARFMQLEELAAVSDFIGVIQVENTEKLGEIFDANLPRRGFWEYSQKNRFCVIEIIKSSAFIDVEKSRIDTLWAEKSFICAAASYRQGRYLVFLESVGPREWITINHQLGGIRIENDSVEFGWYIDARKEDSLISLTEARRTINKCLLNSPEFEIEAVIPSDLIYNEWQDGREYQKLWFHVYDPPSGYWPTGLTHFTRSFTKSEIDDYQDIAKTGGRYEVKAHWKMGYLIVESIEPKK